MGIISNTGKFIEDEEAFSYALERVYTCDEDKKEFSIEFAKPEHENMTLDSFKRDLIDWYYGKNWIWIGEDFI